MSEWKETVVGKYADVLSGYAFKSEDFSDKGTPVLKIKNVASGSLKMDDVQYYPYEITERLKKFLIKESDILIAMTGSHVTQPSSMVGKVCRYNLKYDSLLNQRVGKIFSKDKDQLNEDYIYYYFKHNDIAIELASCAGGSANQANISPDQIRNLPILLPPIEEQISIAFALKSLDDKIALLSEQNKTMEELAELLFDNMFWEEGSETWEEESLDEIAKYLNGLALQKYPSIEPHYLRVIKIREMKQGFSENSDKCSRNIPKEYIVQDGDVLFSWSGSLEVVIWHGGEGALNQHLFKVTSDKYPKWFYYLSTRLHLDNFKIIAESKSTTMGHIQRNHLKEAKVLIPSKEVFDKYDEAISPLIDKLIKNNSQIKLLIQTKDLLLPKLINQELLVR
jgi:type I restriction enzyme S subunit